MSQDKIKKVTETGNRKLPVFKEMRTEIRNPQPWSLRKGEVLSSPPTLMAPSKLKKETMFYEQLETCTEYRLIFNLCIYIVHVFVSIYDVSLTSKSFLIAMIQ